jgi:hypothetical protein
MPCDTIGGRRAQAPGAEPVRLATNRDRVVIGEPWSIPLIESILPQSQFIPVSDSFPSFLHSEDHILAPSPFALRPSP